MSRKLSTPHSFQVYWMFQEKTHSHAMKCKKICTQHAKRNIKNNFVLTMPIIVCMEQHILIWKLVFCLKTKWSVFLSYNSWTGLFMDHIWKCHIDIFSFNLKLLLTKVVRSPTSLLLCKQKRSSANIEWSVFWKKKHYEMSRGNIKREDITSYETWVRIFSR